MIPEVSCITPTINRRIFVRQAIKYFERFTGPEAEMIIVDGGTHRLSQDEVKDHPRVTIIQVPPSMPLGNALNAGIKIARGKYIARQDDDDWYSTNYLEYMLQKAQESKNGIVKIAHCYHYDLFDANAWVGGSCGEGLFFPKKIWEQVPFPPLALKEDIRFLKSAIAFTGEKALEILDGTQLHAYVRHCHNVTGLWPSRTKDPNAIAGIREVLGSDLKWYDALTEMCSP